MSRERGARLDLAFVRGLTFSKVLRLGSRPFIYKAITAIVKTAPVRVTAVAHAMVDGWSAAVVSVKGMTEINAQNTPPRSSDFHQATVVDVDTIEFNDVNAADFSAYVSGGYLQFFTPADLAGASAQLVVTADDGAVLLTLNAVVDDTAKTITFTESAAATAAMTWTNGSYEAKVTFANATVKPLAHGDACVED